MLEKIINLTIILTFAYIIIEIYKYHYTIKERFVNQIDKNKYVQIATAIENVITQDGDLDSFKKETKLNNFDPDLYNELIKERNQTRKKLDMLNIKLVFAKVGKEKSLKSVK